MGGCIAGDSGGVYGRIRSVCGACAGRATGRKRAGFDFWSDWIRLHDFRGAAWRAETGAGLANRTSASVDARALVAGIVELASNFISWRIPLWRDADKCAPVAADDH